MMILTSLNNLGLGAAGVLSGLGYGVVFAGLIALMVVVIIIGKVFAGKKAAPKEETPAPAPAPVEEVPGNAAPGSAGRLKIYDVSPKTAAMLMAIVANKMGKPLNELRFISIKEVK